MENSILFPGVVVEAGAEVRDSVLFKETVVRKNAKVAYVVADKRVEILEGRTLMGEKTYPVVLEKGSVI